MVLAVHIILLGANLSKKLWSYKVHVLLLTKIKLYTDISLQLDGQSPVSSEVVNK